MPIEFGGLLNTLHETQVPSGCCFSCSNVSIDRGILEGRQTLNFLGARSGASATDVCLGAAYGRYTGNEIYEITSTATGGASKWTWNGQTTPDAINWYDTAAVIQSELEELSNINPGDVVVSGGPLNALPIYVDFRGQYAQASQAAITIGAGLTGGSATVTEYIQGGTFEYYLVMIQPNGSGTCTLYKVTSSDGFVANFSFTSIGTGFHASTWLFQQYAGAIYGVNQVDGVLKVIFGGAVISQLTAPATPNTRPVQAFGSTQPAPSVNGANDTNLDLSGATIVLSGFPGTAPTVTKTATYTKIALAANGAIAAPTQVTVTATLGSPLNLEYRDVGTYLVSWGYDSTASNALITSTGMRIILTNNTSFATTSADNFTAGTRTFTPLAMSGAIAGVPWSIQVGQVLSLDTGGSQENVTVTAITSTAFTCVTTNAHDGSMTPFAISGVFVTTVEPTGYSYSALPINPNTGQAAPSGGGSAEVGFSFYAQNRLPRAAVAKIQFKFTISEADASKVIFLYGGIGDNWLGDENGAPAPFGIDGGSPTLTNVNYAYSYYDVDIQQESQLSPITTTQSMPNNTFGFYSTLTLIGNKSLLTSDKIYVYRQEVLTGLWRLLQNADGTYGVPNVTSGTTSFVDHNMEDELGVYPVPTVTGFGAAGNGAAPECIGVWKGSLVIGGKKQLWFSRVGAPNTFAQSPDNAQPNNQALLLQGPGRAVTMYASSDRSEDVYNIIGQDALYVSTSGSTYCTLTDQPSDIIAVRPIRSARASLGYRAAIPYYGSVLEATKNGLWLYRVSRMWSDLDGGNDQEQELTKDCRRSWDRFISPYFQLAFQGSGNTAGTFSITVKGQTATIPYNASANAIKVLVEGLSNMNVGDVEVVTNCDTTDANCLANAGAGVLHLRFLGQRVGQTFSSTDVTADGSGVGPNGVTIGVSAMSLGGTSAITVSEYIDNIWVFNGQVYLIRSRMGKWSEGTVEAAVTACCSTRLRGLVFFSSTGQMFRLGLAAGGF